MQPQGVQQASDSGTASQGSGTGAAQVWGGLIANFEAWALCKPLAEARSRFVEQGGSRLPCPPGRLPIVEQPHRVLVQVVPKWTSHGGGLIANFKAWALCKLLAEAGRSRFVEQGGSWETT